LGIVVASRFQSEYVERRRVGVPMLQKNHHFLFPETYFGSFADFEDELFGDEEDLVQTSDPWILNLETDTHRLFQQKIGLFIHWTDHFG
jgi:hypothetical protein